jgi:hypothetical protein
MTPTRFRRAAAALALGCLLFGGARARAQSADERARAEALARDAVAAEASGDRAGAALLYQRAATLTHDPDLFEKLARTLATLGRAQDEASAWRAFLDAAPPDDARRPEAEARVATIEGWIAATARELSGLPEGARLYVDGRPFGAVADEARVRVPPGRHELLVRAEGYEDFRTTEVSPVGGVVHVDVSMAALPVPPRPVLPVALWAAGGAALATGAALGPIALRRSDHQALDTPEGERTRRMAIGTDVVLAAGAALALAGGALYYFFYREPDAGGSAALQIAPFAGPTALGITARGAF